MTITCNRQHPTATPSSFDGKLSVTQGRGFGCKAPFCLAWKKGSSFDAALVPTGRGPSFTASSTQMERTERKGWDYPTPEHVVRHEGNSRSVESGTPATIQSSKYRSFSTTAVGLRLGYSFSRWRRVHRRGLILTAGQETTDVGMISKSQQPTDRRLIAMRYTV